MEKTDRRGTLQNKPRVTTLTVASRIAIDPSRGRQTRASSGSGERAAPLFAYTLLHVNDHLCNQCDGTDQRSLRFREAGRGERRAYQPGQQELCSGGLLNTAPPPHQSLKMAMPMLRHLLMPSLRRAPIPVTRATFRPALLQPTPTPISARAFSSTPAQNKCTLNQVLRVRSALFVVEPSSAVNNLT